MPSRPWFKWYPNDYLSDTYTLSWDADLLYRRILDALWTHGPLPRDLGDLSKILRIDPRKIRRIFPEVLPYLSEISGRLDHPRIAEQRRELIEKQAEAAKAGRKGGLAKSTNARARARGPALPARARPDPEPERSKPLHALTPSLLPGADGGRRPESVADIAARLASEARAKAGKA